MSTPAWILETFAAVMILVAEVSVGQLIAARAWTRRGGTNADVAISHLLMGIAMAGMLVPGLSVLSKLDWEAIFVAMTCWFIWCLWQENRGRSAAAIARGSYAPHLVHSAAMVYMFAALAGPSAPGSGMSMSMSMSMSMGGMSTGLPVLALVFALLLVAFTVHDLGRRAGLDGYFQVVGRPFMPAGSGPAAAAAGPAAAHPAERLLLSPAVAKGCQVVMGITMAFTLIIMT